ncbi:hypothetical protein GUITHDRAFT_134884 [Guillardia theta CCMP2712]|uniref:NmrA-like domain-containing protein n=1 Tax=Guillardia theta (strain CCMP2712) TaxID=905079 RepID=L1JRR1_GUITC|nr:hypothetical protein GUITHDRAFT_134884 [Guillardia theta CCMP2712]EKX50763.1 hypothetical protein GUITHDRAFT_134884 [Guillardia theta CCMP2712]|eukprot:XP_005837743.1 hypothetical protein GUITHDRAFT_134884 [Guillardia theta CCMP2712]
MARLVSVVTASSNSGAQCVRDLLQQEALKGKAKVRAVYRTKEKADAALAELGKHESDWSLLALLTSDNLECIHGVDAMKMDTLMTAFEGAEVAVIVTPHDAAVGFANDAEMCHNMVNAAVSCNVKHIVYVGSWTVAVSQYIKIISSRFASTEKLLRELGEQKKGMYLQITWNHLRSGFFNQNLVHMMGHGVKAGKVRFPDMKIPCVDPRDMGTMAAFIACSDYAKEHANCCYEVSGPENLTSAQIVEAIGTAVGKKVEYEPVPIKEHMEKLPQFMKEVFHCMEELPDSIPCTDDVEKVTGIRARTLSAWLNENAAAFA